RQQHLLRVEPELPRHVLERVDRGAVDVGLAGLAQSADGDVDAEAGEQALQRRGAAVHARRLDDLGDEQLHFCPEISGPAARSTGTAGETRAISTSTVPGRPCSTGTRASLPRSMASSTRTKPLRNSFATRSTRAGMAPYWVQGKPSSRKRARWPART